MTDTHAVLAAFHRTLVEEIRAHRPEYLSGPFTVAEIYQNLVPYSTHRDRIGVDMNADYEDTLLRLLAGEGDYLVLESGPALRGLREELESSNPNTGLYREYAAVDVHLNPDFVDGGVAEPEAGSGQEVELQSMPDADHEPPPVPMDALAPSLDFQEPAAERVSLPEEAPSEEVEETERAADSTDACRWCRAKLPDRSNLNFCPFCGTDVNVVPCGGCGEELEPEWRFCVACGTEVET